MDDDLRDEEAEPISSRHPTLLAVLMVLTLLALYAVLIRCGLQQIGPIVSH